MSDNILGLPTVGNKIACKLIAQFGCLSKLFKTINMTNMGNISCIIKNNLDYLIISKELVQLKSNIILNYKIFSFISKKYK